MDDAELLACYAQSRSEPAFAELVRRHVDLVYTAALRQVGGDPHRAEEVTQMVFISLARKASSLVRHPALLAWLHQSARFAAANVRRDEGRRRMHESAAAMETTPAAGPRVDWERLRPVLDDAVTELNRADREAVLMRFFANRPFAEVGQRFGLSENAARMRVERALVKLQAGLARRGIASTAAALSVALSGNAVLAAPAGVAASATGAALVGAAGRGGGLALLHLMSSIKLQAGIAAFMLTAGAATVVWQHQANARLRRNIDALGQQSGIASLSQGMIQIVGLRNENQRLAQASSGAGDLQQAEAELARLRAEGATSRDQPGVYDPSQLDEQPIPTHQAVAQYPAALKAAGTEGKAVIEFVIQPDGTVSAPWAVYATDPAFGDAAQAAVQQWQFKPGQRRGRPVAARVQVPMVFTLKSEGSSWF
jgi:RNA polymerase sigma factor (sigma-70 family)